MGLPLARGVPNNNRTLESATRAEFTGITRAVHNRMQLDCLVEPQRDFADVIGRREIHLYLRRQNLRDGIYLRGDRVFLDVYARITRRSPCLLRQER